MAIPKKKRQLEDGSAATGGVQEVVITMFDGRHLEKEDFHGINQLVKQLFLKAPINISELTDVLIDQSGVGSVLKQTYEQEEDAEEIEEDSDDDDSFNVIFAITTVANLTANKEKECIKQIRSYLSEKAKKHCLQDEQDKVLQLLADVEPLGLIIHERFLNLPAQLSEAMLTSLQKDIKSKSKKEPTYNFKYYILICKTYKLKKTDDTETFVNEEEQIFFQEADFSFDFTVEKDKDNAVGGKWCDDDQEIIPYRKVVFFKAEKLNDIITKITNLFNN